LFHHHQAIIQRHLIAIETTASLSKMARWVRVRVSKQLTDLAEGNGGRGSRGITQQGVVGEERLLGEPEAETGIAATAHWVLAHGVRGWALELGLEIG
jgi:hypothetical protein